MPESQDPTHAVPEARVAPKGRMRISFVWVIPIVAALAGVWVAVTQILSKGPEITITFRSADGLKAGKTKVDYKGLTVGTITAVRLAEDDKHFVATARMDSTAEDFLHKDTQFWIVQPEISGLDITGLDTLISGDYIALQPGKSSERARAFVALDTPPLPADVPGRRFTLTTAQLGSLRRGTPIYYRQLKAGQVVSHALDEDGRALKVAIFVQAPYDRFVTEDTRFWKASGIDMSLTANGLQVETESLLSILAGGVAFEAPASGTPSKPADADASFELFTDRAAAFQPPPREPLSFRLVFEQSVRGLVIGAPVEFEGIQIGEVTDMRAQFDAASKSFSVPVTIRVDPARFGVRVVDLPAGEDDSDTRRALMSDLVASGLRAQLKTGSFLSGALFVALNVVPDAPQVTLDWSKTPVELPTIPGRLEALEANLVSIVKQLEGMKFEQISDDLRKTLGELDATLASARTTFAGLDEVLGTADKLIAPDSVLISGADGALQELSGAARSLRVLTDYLERHPEALLRGKTDGSH